MRVSLFVCLALGLAATAAASDPLTDAKAVVGHTCPHMFADRDKDFPGFATPKGFLTVTLGNDGWIFPMEKGGRRFAFLITGLGEVCKVNDVVELPTAAEATAWLQCHERDALVEGFGMRKPGKPLAGFWTVSKGKIVRQPAPAPGGVLCQEPETGD